MPKPVGLFIPCPRYGHLRLMGPNGRIVPGQCRRYDCHACIVPEGLDVGRALALARPDWLLTLTLVGDSWPAIRERMQRFHERLREQGAVFEHAYHVEINPTGTGHHTHGYVTCSGGLCPEAVSRAARKAKLAFERRIEPFQVPPGADPILRYGLKSVLLRPAGATELWPQARGFLEINNNHLVHATKRFWRDGETGALLGHRRAATRVARDRAGLGGRHVPSAARMFHTAAAA